MALLLRPSRLSIALHRPGAARTQKLAPPTKAPTLRIAVSLPRPLFAATVEAPTACRPALYLLHRHLPRSTDGQDGSASQQQLHQLHDDLKVLEKVAKRAAWFSTIEASDGEHVLLLTDCAKLGRKYSLQTMPADASSFTLDLPGRSVVVPLAEISTGLLGQKRAESSQYEAEASSGDEDSMAVAAAQVVTDKDAEKAAKERRKEEEKAAKALAKAEKMARKAAAGESGKGGEDSDESDEEEKEMEKKAEKKKEKEEKKMMKKQEKAAMAKDMDDDSDEEESSDSSGSEEEEEDKIGSAKKDKEAEMKAEKVQDDSGSESEEEDGSDGSSSEEVAIPQANMEQQAVGGTKVQPMMGKEEDSESEEDSSSESESESDESGSESDEEMVGMKAVEIGEIKPLEA